MTPFLMFEGRAEEAIKFYAETFQSSRILKIDRYGAGQAGPEGSVRLAHFELKGQEFMCIDSPAKHDFYFYAVDFVLYQLRIAGRNWKILRCSIRGGANLDAARQLRL